MENIFKFYTHKIDNCECFGSAVEALFDGIYSRSGKSAIRVVVFGSSRSNEEYLEQRTQIFDTVAKLYDGRLLCSYIAQKPFDGELVAEVTELSGDVPHYWGVSNDIRYLQMKYNGRVELMTGGIYSQLESGIASQSVDIFKRLSALLAALDYSIDDITRQWNYIERIVDIENNKQHYQIFNDARTIFYRDTQWSAGYPAATGIGMQYGGVIVEVNATMGSHQYAKAIDNSLQRAAHIYSQEVLVGEAEFGIERSTPKFERGKVVDYNNSPLFYISGTAAIRGEESVAEGDVVAQNIATMENIDHLISTQNRELFGDVSGVELGYGLLRVYIKEDSDAAAVLEYMKPTYPHIELIFVKADVCRDELLIEIEGFASAK